MRCNVTMPCGGSLMCGCVCRLSSERCDCIPPPPLLLLLLYGTLTPTFRTGSKSAVLMLAV